MANPNLNNLGHKVTTRETNILDLAMRAWGSEFNAPDPGLYVFGYDRKFDSTDRGQTGIYTGTLGTPSSTPP
jgi:hypothetical protein